MKMLLRSFLNVRRVAAIFQIDINQERLTFIILDERAEAIFFGEKSKLKKFNLIRAIFYKFCKEKKYTQYKNSYVYKNSLRHSNE